MKADKLDKLGQLKKFDLKGSVGKLKERWKNKPERTRKMIVAIGGGVLCTAMLMAVVMGNSSGKYKVLFPGMTETESVEVYAVLQDMGVNSQIDAGGQLLVPTEQWEQLVFELNGQGYPQTAPSYDTFTSLSGFTSTEFEKKAGLIFQAQDRMQETLVRQTGIKAATVTFSVPESSNYIWDESNQRKSTGNVTVQMMPGYELTPERVSAIKHLASTSIPKLEPENVVVIDANTGVEMPGVNETGSEGYYSVRRLEYERAISKQIEDNVKRLLAGKYGPDGVTAVASVSLNYDKMVSESKQFQSQDGTNSGVISHFDEKYSLNGSVAAENIVGEENNTDAPPIYPTIDGAADASATDYEKNIDYEVGYIMTQIEKGEPILDKATVAVVVNDPAFDTQVEETLVKLISKAVNISSDNISVSNLQYATQDVSSPMGSFGLSQQQLMLLGIGAVVLILLILLVIFLSARSRKRKKQAMELAAAAEAQAAAEAEKQKELDAQREIEEHKKMLRDEAEANVNAKENAITNEIRDFAQKNPEITAALLRSLMREEK